MVITETRLRSQIIDPVGDPRWEALVSGRPDATVFHTPQWLSVLRNSYGYEPRAAVLESEDGSLAAGAPYCLVRSRLTGNRIVSLPFCDYAPPLTSSGEETGRLLEAMQSEAGSSGRVSYTQLRWGHLPEAPAALDAWSSDDSYSNYVVDLTGSLDDLERGLHSSARRAIRKAGREGLTAEVEGGIDAVRSFYRMNVLTRRKHGTFPQPWRFLEEIHRRLISRENGFLVTAYYEGQPIAADFVLCSNETAFYKYNASDPRFLGLRPNNLALWHAICESKRRGMKAFDLGRVDAGNEGLRRFKLLWGAEEQPLPYFSYPASNGVAGGEQGTVYRLAAPVLRRAPTGVLSVMGRALYRHFG
ncbi:MAG: lipid II:glycine glycyltransferase FemX [Chloroflexota bacterium]